MPKALWPAVFVLLLLNYNSCNGQSFSNGDVVFNANIGVPHLFKTATKIAVKSDAFAKNFDGRLDVSEISGMNPTALRGEYAFNKFFGLGLNYSFWNIRFSVTDHYNIQRNSAGSVYSDSVDIYTIKIKSKSFGLRPNFHFPIKSEKHDLYIGIGIGITTNQLSIGFSSTDAGRFVKNFHKNLAYNLSLPGGLYIAPSIGYRAYVNKNLGLNFEVGYEKGAIIQVGLVFKFNPNNS